MLNRSSFLLGACICFMPFYLPFANFLDGRWEKDILFVLISLVYIGYSRTKNLAPLSLILISFLVMSNTNQAPSLFQTGFFCLSVLFASRIEHDGEVETLYRWIELSCVLVLGWVMWEHFYSSPLWWYPVKNVALVPGLCGPLFQNTLTGAYIAITSQVFYRRKSLWILYMPCLYCLYLLSSSMAWGCFVGALGFQIATGLEMNGKTFWIGLASISAMTIVALMIPEAKIHEWLDPQERIRVWKIVWGLPFSEGWGKIRLVLPALTQNGFAQYFNEAHCEYLELFYAMGASGFLVLYWVFKAFMKADMTGRGIILATGLNAMANLTLHISPISLVFLVVVGYWLNKVDDRYDYGTMVWNSLWRKSYEIFAHVCTNGLKLPKLRRQSVSAGDRRSI